MSLYEKAKNTFPTHLVDEVGNGAVRMYKDYEGRNGKKIMVMLKDYHAIVYRAYEGADELVSAQKFECNENYFLEGENVLSRRVVWVNRKGFIEVSSFLINHFTDDTIIEITEDFVKFYELQVEVALHGSS